MTNLVIGGVPRREDYFGREDLIERLWGRLQRDNVLLVAPRRSGKTGAMYRLLDEPREPFHPIYMDVEPIESAAGFMIDFIAILLKDRIFSRIGRTLLEGARGVSGFLRDLPASIEIGELKIRIRERADIDQHWLSYGERALALLSKESPSLLLMIDEFPIMTWTMAQRDRADAERFLRWFRAARTAPETRTRFLIGGSTNLVSTLDEFGLVDTANDLCVERLAPFDEHTARRFIETIFSGRRIALSEEVTERILDLVGAPIPYLLSVLLTAVFERHGAGGSPVTPQIVTAAFEEDLLGGATSIVFQHYRSRLDQYYPGLEARAARGILGLLSRSPRAVEHATLYQIFLRGRGLGATAEAQEEFVRLMNKLENDFYIVIEEGKYRFFSRVLQLWWKNRYAFQGE